jgi:hypothetical protein
MPSTKAGKWSIFSPSVIRDAISGSLGFQEQFGTTYVSGATQALVLKQNAIDSSATEGDAVLYAGTTNGGLYSLNYDYSTDSWATQWTWLSQPSGSADGFQGNQGIGALALSPDGSMIAVGMGNSSNYNAYTPNGVGLQFGSIQPDGSIEWLKPPSPDLLAGYPQLWNARDFVWRDDGLYIAISGVKGDVSKIYQLDVDETGQFLTPPKQVSSLFLPMALDGNLTGDSAVFYGFLYEGIFSIDSAGASSKIDAGSTDWNTLYATRFDNSEAIGRLVSEINPLDPDGRVLLIGWYQYENNITTGSISHVDRLTLDADNTVTAVESIDFSGLAGSSQASPASFYGNYALGFDPRDESLNTIYVGGNQYLSSHPDGTTPYSPTGGLISGDFTTGAIHAVFGPYADAEGQLVDNSVLIGAPHADSRTLIHLQTLIGERVIQSDDGGVWQLVASETQPSELSWQSLNRPGLHSLETMSSGWDARSNSLVQAFQDNAVSIAQIEDTYLSNVWDGDGSLAIVDGALPNDENAQVWSYVNSQRYMSSGFVVGMALEHSGAISQVEMLRLITNLNGSSVQPIESIELYALMSAGMSSVSGNFSFPSMVNPSRPGDVVLAGNSGLYETFIPNWSDYAQAQNSGTLQMLPLIPFDTAKRSVTSISLGTTAQEAGAITPEKPFFWDAMVATTWDSVTQQSTIWYRDALTLYSAPASLAEVDKDFIESIGLVAALTSEYLISDTAIQTDSAGQIETVYWLEATSSLRYLQIPGTNLPFYPSTDQGALVIARGDQLTRLPYAQTPGLDQLVREGDFWGPTAIEFLPAREGFAAQLVVAGEHGLFASELDDLGMPTGFTPMSIDGMTEQTQYGSAIMELTYSSDDDLLIASVLGGGSFLYSRSGELGETPIAIEQLHVSHTKVPQNAAETLDKRGNPVQGQFFIELPDSAFDQAGTARINFIIEDADLWRTHLEGVSLYRSTGTPFNLLDNDLQEIREQYTFYEFANMRMGSFLTKSDTQELPTISLACRVELLDADNAVIDNVITSIDLVPNGSTPAFSVFTELLPEDRAIFQARYGFGDGVTFQKLPFAIKAALSGGLPDGTRVFAYQVDDLNGAIIIDGQTYLPSSENYLEAVLSRTLDSSAPLTAQYAGDDKGLLLQDLSSMFLGGSISDFLSTEGQYFGTTLTVKMPELYGAGILNANPLVGIAIQYPGGELKVTTSDAASFDGNVINLTPTQANQGVVLDVGYGGIFATQQSSGEIVVAKLGGMQSATGFFRVDDLFGKIDGITPGADGYAEVALSRSMNENLDITLTQAYGTTASYELDGFIEGCYYASYITLNTATAQDALQNLLDSSSTSSDYVLFSMDEANPDLFGQSTAAAIPFASDIIAFEDMPYRGDMDFNDIVMFYGDTLTLAGALNSALVQANENNDGITGSAFADTLGGGAGNDSITGGLLADTMTGGAGVNTFVFTAVGTATAGTYGNLVTGVVDVITDFKAGAVGTGDVINWDLSGPTTTLGAAQTAVDWAEVITDATAAGIGTYVFAVGATAGTSFTSYLVSVTGAATSGVIQGAVQLGATGQFGTAALAQGAILSTQIV